MLNESMSSIKINGIDLCIQKQMVHIIRPGYMQQLSEHGAADALKPVFSQYRHTADLAAIQQAGRSQWLVIGGKCQNVQRSVVPAIPFFDYRDMLLLDEDRKADSAQDLHVFPPTDLLD